MRRITFLLLIVVVAGCSDPAGPGPAAQILFRVQPVTGVAGGVLSAVQVEVRDADGRSVGDDVPVTLSLRSDSVGISLGGTTSSTSSAGIATFSNLSITKAGVGYRLVAASGELPEAVSATFDVDAASPAGLAFQGQPQSAGLVWPAITPAIEVVAEDAFGNRVHTPVSVTVALGSNQSGAALQGTTSRTTASGVASFPDLRVDRAGNDYTIVASAPAVSASTSVPFDVRLGKLAAGHFHACGLTDTGEAYCWGHNNAGQLGDGTNTTRQVPVRAAAGLTFESIRPGRFHSCAIATGGQAYCWGLGTSGQLGNGANINSFVPVPVTGGHSFTQLAVGQSHTCGLRADGVVFCWGTDQFGLGGAGASNTPQPVAGGHHFVSVSAGFLHTCGLSNAGHAYCWGGNDLGQLGDGTDLQRHVPTAVSGGIVFTRLYVGSLVSCGITAVNETYCWGNNGVGAVGDGSTDTARVAPARVSTNRRYVTLALGTHVCGMTENGSVECWGDNRWGGFGNGDTANANVPVPAANGIRFASIAVGIGHSCGVTVEGQPYCWGRNSSGQVGDGTTGVRDLPVPVSGGLIFARRQMSEEPLGFATRPWRGRLNIGP